MYQDKKNRSEKYHQKKKLQQKYDKFQKKSFNQEESNLIESISKMSASQMYNFIDKKFDKVVQSNQKLLPKICSAIKKRMDNFTKDFKEQQRQNFLKFVRKHTGKTVSQQDIKQVFDRQKLQPFKLKSNQLIHVGFGWQKHIQPKIFLIKVTIYEPNKQISNIKQNFYLKGLDQNTFQQLQFKRIKKDGLKFLQQYSQNLKRVQKALNQQ